MEKNYVASKFPPFILLDEPLLAFNPNNPKAQDLHPLRGLVKYGPYTSSVFKSYSPNLRIAIIAPAVGWKHVGELMKTLQTNHKAEDRKEYLPDYPGFESLFGVPIIAAEAGVHIKWPDDLVFKDSSKTPEVLLNSAINDAMKRLSLMHDKFDIAVFHFPEKWKTATKTESFDAHDSLKALGAQYSIPTQVLNDRAFAFRYKASIAWRLGIAMYVKAGGVPWKLSTIPGIPEGTAYIGLAYALRGNPQEAHYVTCCSQVFDMDGGGMQFVAFEARDPVKNIEEAKRNPFLSRDDMRAVLARSLHLYQNRNGGVIPKRLVIHKTTAFKEEELLGAHDALAGVPEVECIEISSTPWRGVWLIDSGNPALPSKPSGYPVPRGTMMINSENSTLLWIAGNAPGASTTNNYYQGKKSIPRPLLLTRHAGKGPLETIALEALALSKMDWNNDALYDPVPVTITYSQCLARTIANVPDLPNNAYPYRLFM